MSRTPGVVFVFSLFSAAAHAEPSNPAEQPPASARIVVSEPTPLPFLLVTPSGAPARVRSSILINLVSDLFDRHTDFAVALVDPVRVADCEGRLPCLVQAVRTDYDRSALEDERGFVLPFAVYRERVREKGTPVAEALFVLSSIASGDADRLLPQWVDTDEALAITHEADRSRPDWSRDVEARVREYAIPVTLGSATIRSEAEARAFLGRLITEKLRPELERTGHWEPYGRVVLNKAPDGAAVMVDGRTVGTSRSGSVRLERLRPGPHRIELSAPDGSAWGKDIDLPRGGEIALFPALRGSKRTHPGRTAILWSGIGLAVGGAVTTAWALSVQDDRFRGYCPEGCSDRFLRIGEDTSTGEGGAVLAAPLGYSLALTGLTWTLGSALVGEKNRFPWWSVLGGLALGGAAYGISAAVDPGRI